MSNSATMNRSMVLPSTGRVHLLTYGMLFSMILPISFQMAGLYMTPMRLYFLLVLPVLGVNWLMGKYGKLRMPDYLLMFFIFWMAVTVWRHHPSQLLTFTGSTAATIMGGYLIARATVRNAADFIAFCKVFALLVVGILLPLGLIEALNHNGSIALRLLGQFSFWEVYLDYDYCCRLGLDRAQTVFVHPIHHGVFCSLAFALYFFGLTNHASLGTRLTMGALVGLAAFTSVSSGAVLVVAFQGLLMLYGLAFYTKQNQWRHLVILGLILYFILELNTTKFALFTLSEKLAFDSWNVYIRGVLYNAGMDQIARTPIFGFGYNRLPSLPFWMTGSTDNYWLQIAVSHGLPAFFAAASLVVYSMVYAGRTGNFRKGSDLYYARVSWVILMVGLTLSLTTVAIWAEVQSMVFFMIGLGQFLFYAEEPKIGGETDTAADTSARKGPVYTRFPRKGMSSSPSPRSAIAFNRRLQAEASR